MHNHRPAKLPQGRTEADLEQTGLCELLPSQGVQLHAADQVLAARRVTAREARLLQAPRKRGRRPAGDSEHPPPARPRRHNSFEEALTL